MSRDVHSKNLFDEQLMSTDEVYRLGQIIVGHRNTKRIMQIQKLEYLP